MEMKFKNTGSRRFQRQTGSALVVVVIMLVGLMILTAASLDLSSSLKKQVTASVSSEQARLLAEAGLSESVTALRSGRSGNVGRIDWPAYVGTGIFWVQATNLDNGNVRLVSTALVGSGRVALEMVVRNQKQGLGDLFSVTLSSKDVLTLNADVMIDSFDSTLGTYLDQQTHFDNGHAYANTEGDVRSNDDIIVNARAGVFGDVVPGPGHDVTLNTDSFVWGFTNAAEDPFNFPDLDVPSFGSSGPLWVPGSTTLAPGNYEFDDLEIGKGGTLTIEGPATIVVQGEFVGGVTGRLAIDATNGPVTIYCDVYVHMKGFECVPIKGSPMAVAFLVQGNEDIVFPSKTMVRGAYYAENSNIIFTAGNEAWGSFVGNQVSMSSGMQFHYDESLADQWEGTPDGETQVDALAWYETNLEPEFISKDRGDPLALLGLDPDVLPRPAQAWWDPAE